MQLIMSQSSKRAHPYSMTTSMVKHELGSRIIAQKLSRTKGGSGTTWQM